MKKHYIYGFLVVFLAALFIISCGGGGSNSESNSLTLSSTSAYPGEFVTFTHDSFKTDNTVNVTWSDGLGYEVKSEGYSPKDKTLMVSVPAYLNLEKGVLAEGKVNVSLSGISEVKQLNIQKPKEINYVNDDRPGSVIIDSLKDDILNYQSALNNLDGFSVDTTDMVSKTVDEISRLQATVTEFETMGTFTLYASDGTTKILSDQELRDTESLLFTMMRGMMLALDATSTTARFEREQFITQEVITQEEIEDIGSDFVKGLSKGLKVSMNQAKNGSKIFIAGVGVVGAVAALALAPAEVAVGTALLIGTLSSAAYVMISGVHTEGMAAMSHQIDKQTLTPSTYEKGEKIFEAVEEGAQNLALSLGAVGSKFLGGLVELGNNIKTLVTTEIKSVCEGQDPSERQLVSNLYRETPPTLAETKEFCEDIGTPLVCSPDQKIIDGVCVNKTCKVDNYKCPTCTGDQDLAYNSDGSGVCELNCSSSQKEVGDRCVNKTCQADAYNCPTCTGDQVLAYNSDGSGVCELNCSDSQKAVDDRCVDKTCQADTYNCPTCTTDETLKYNDDGSGYCEKLCAPPTKLCADFCIESNQTCCPGGFACQAGFICTADGEGCCPSDSPIRCGSTGCMPAGNVCCEASSTNCPAGTVCHQEGGCCPASTPLSCGPGCMPAGAQCCNASGAYCPAGSSCTATGCTSGKERVLMKKFVTKTNGSKDNVQSNPLLNLQRSNNPTPFWKR